ncbi:MAG TPA: FGGY-family carbohydrate kinase [Acidimicrobiales bacterium]|nr:FGGY-family carbohydrate kinase [Acidimicrobiales bacterium]
MSGSVTVGIDIGTTATKAVAADAQGNVIARSRVAHRLLTPEPDHIEHEARRAWLQGPLKALAQLSAVAPELSGVCVCSMVPSLTGVDRRGRPIGPGLLYGDARGRGTQPLGRDRGRAEVSEVMPDAVGFLRWAVKEMPAAAGYWPAQAVANYALAGVPAIDTAMTMSLGDLRVGTEWNSEMLDEIGVRRSQLPEVVPMAERAGEVRGTSAVIAPGTVDAFCDQIVSGAEHTGDVLVICGATLVVWAVVDEWIECPGLWTVPHLVGGKVMVGGPSNAGALFVDWARSLLEGGFRRSPPPSARSALAVVGPDEASRDPALSPRVGDPRLVPVWLPYVRGERAPFHDPTLRASLHDLHIGHDAAAVERAAYEASGFVVRAMLDRAGIKAKRIVASGGGTRVVPWMQALADATGLPVDMVAVPEGAALGAAFVARMAAGFESELADAGRWARIGCRVEPDSLWAQAAAARYERFRAMNPAG